MKFLLTISICFSAFFIYGQGKPQHANISLNDIAKVQLIKGPGSYSEYEITQDSTGIWTCRQTIVDDFEKKTPTFNKVVSRDKLHELLTYFNQPDTSIDLDRFDLKYTELVRYIDSMKYISLTPEQRRILMEVLANRDTLTAALRRIFAFSPRTDGYYRQIKLITKSGAEHFMEKNGTEYPYDMPWTFGDYRMFDPRIVRLFYELTGKEKIERQLRHSLHEWVVRNIFNENYYTSFSWANFRADYPSVAALAGLTLVPRNFGNWAWRPGGWFTSALLPGNWLIQVRSLYPYFAMQRLRTAEKLIAAAYKMNKKSFDEIGVKPTEFLFFQIFGGDLEEDVERERETLKELKSRFPEVNIVDREKLIMMMVWDLKQRSHSKMLLLPDGKLISL